MNERVVTKKMLSKIREGRVRKANEINEEFKFEPREFDNFLTRSKILMEEASSDNKESEDDNEEKSSSKDYLAIRKNTPQFGNVRTSQEETIRKTINDNVTFSEEALKYYPKAKDGGSDDLILDGKIPSLNITFQFRYSDPSGTDGIYMWSEGLQLTDANVRTVGKLRSSYMNWRDSITQDGDLMERLAKACKED